MSQWISLDTPTGRISAWRADPPIPAENVARIVELHHRAEHFVYPAAHGFNCVLRR